MILQSPEHLEGRKYPIEFVEWFDKDRKRCDAEWNRVWDGTYKHGYYLVCAQNDRLKAAELKHNVKFSDIYTLSSNATVSTT